MTVVTGTLIRNLMMRVTPLLATLLFCTHAGAETLLISVKAEGTTLERTASASVRLANTGGRAFSNDGRYLVFQSSASNLVAPPPGRNISAVYRYDQIEDTVVGVSLDGLRYFSADQSSVSGDGQRVVFRSFDRNLPGGDLLFDARVYVRDLATGAITLVCKSSTGEVANQGCNNPAISADGRHVVFDSSATNLVATDNNNQTDVFVHDLQSATTQRISQTAAGAGGSAASAHTSIGNDASVIAFTTASTNLDAGVANGLEQILVAGTGIGFTTISVGQAGVAGNSRSDRAIVAAGGQQVTFQSSATNLVAVDGGGAQQVYVRDLTTDTTTIVSRTMANVAGNGGSTSGALSADGSLVAFLSNAFNLIAGDVPGVADGFLSSVASNTLTVLNLMDRRVQKVQLSGDGSTTATEIGEDFDTEVRLLDTNSGAEFVLPANEHQARSANGFSNMGERRALSSDGRLVLFYSGADNMDSNDNNANTDLFLYDGQTDRATLLSRTPSGESANAPSRFGSITGDGRFVLFTSTASDLVADDNNLSSDLFLLDRDTGTITRESTAVNGDELASGARAGGVSEDGRFVTFSSTENVLGAADFVEFSTGVYLRDRELNTTVLVNQPSTGGWPFGFVDYIDISGDGRYVIFVTSQDDLLGEPVADDQLYLYDRDSESLRLISHNAGGELADADIIGATLSRDGRFAVFFSAATNLVPADSSETLSVFLADLITGAIELISINSDGDNASDRAYFPAISDNGRLVSFGSSAENLSPEVRNGLEGVFLRDREAGTTALVSLNSAGEMANDYIELAQLAGDGSHIAFDTAATNFSGAVNARFNVYRRALERTQPPLRLVSSVLPSSRAAAVGNPITAFATVIATTDLQDCRLGLGAANGVLMQYQTTDAANEVNGEPNAPVNLGAGIPQSYVLTLTPATELPPTELALTANCPGSQGATQVTGVNTLLLSAETAQPADMVALAATPNSDGILELPDDGSFAAFAVATINVGAAATITVRPAVSGQALTETLVCATDIATGICLANPAGSVTLSVASNTTPTFAVFARSTQPVEFLPAVNRLSLTFADGTGAIRGRTSVALQ